jgi:hypothetical protein
MERVLAIVSAIALLAAGALLGLYGLFGSSIAATVAGAGTPTSRSQAMKSTLISSARLHFCSHSRSPSSRFGS